MEIELKLLIDVADTEKLRRHPFLEQHALGKPRQSDLTSIYFDTPDFEIRGHGAGLRVRRNNGEWTQTLKAGGSVEGGLHQRHEWEGPVAEGKPDLEALRQLVTSNAMTAALLDLPSLAARLQPLFSVHVKRTTWELCIDEDEIELALDEGTINYQNAEAPVSEIELELKSGNSKRLYDIALKLLDDVHLRLSNTSKAERGYALCGLAGAEAAKAKPLTLLHDSSIEQGLQNILRDCLAQIQANEGGMIEQNNPESLHQMRVGLRRLRSAIKLFKDFIPCPPGLQQEFEWLASQLGTARDWDVLASRTLARVVEKPDLAFRLGKLQDTVAEVASDKRKSVSQVLYSSRYSRMMLTLFARVEAKEWRNELNPSIVSRLDTSLKGFANEAIARGHKKIIKRGKNILDGDPQSLHRLRIAAKKNRYAAEFFQSLYRPRRVHRYVTALSALQDELGWRNDFSVAGDLLDALQRESPNTAMEASFVRGYLAAERTIEERKLHKTWKKCSKVKLPFKP